MQDTILDLKLKSCKIYLELFKRYESVPSAKHILVLINDIGVYSLNVSKRIIATMGEYTLHDEAHIFNMLYIADKLIPEDTLEKLSSSTLFMIIITIFLHDIGMAPDAKLIKAWNGTLTENEVDSYKEEITKFERFKKTFSQEEREIEILTKKGEFAKATTLLNHIITEYIRQSHAIRAREMIADDWSNKIKYYDTDLTADVADICFSHNDNTEALLNLETVKVCAEGDFLCLPFVAVILRLADIIDFDAKRTPQILFSHLAIENPISLKEWEKHSVINAWSITSNSLVYSAQCSHPAIEETIRQFCDQIDNELRTCIVVLANMNSDMIDLKDYRIKLPAYVNRDKIIPQNDIRTGKPKYHYHNTKFSLSKRQVIDLLMGTKLYGDEKIALRELVQNSIDTCKLRMTLCKSWNIPYEPKIEISYFTEDDVDYLKVTDNGMGMNQYIIDNYYTNIGQSYYTSNEFLDLVSNTKEAFKPISRFGIGILSCFMVCDNMYVNTKRVLGQCDSDKALKISIEGYESLFVIEDSEKKEPGTETILKLRNIHPWKKIKKDDFVSFIKNEIPLPPFEISIKTDMVEEIIDENSFQNLDLNLKDNFDWRKEVNINYLEFDLNDLSFGFKGKAEIAYICKGNGNAVSRIEYCNKTVDVEGETYTLSSNLVYGSDGIEKKSTSLEIDDEGNIDTNEGTSYTHRSKSYLSIHGINVSCNLFREYGSPNNCVFHIPLPIRFRLDIGDNYDLNLNSARTQIICDEKWLKFEKDFINLICRKIKGTTDDDKWQQLKKVILNSTSEKELFYTIVTNY